MIRQLKRFVGLLNPGRILLTLCAYSMLVVGAQFILFLAFQFLDAYSDTFELNQYILLLAALVGVGALNYILGYFLDIAESSYMIRWKRIMKEKIAFTLLNASYADYEKRESGYWFNLLTNDIDSYFDQIKEIAGCIVMFPAGIFMLVLSLRLNIPLTLATLGMGALQFFIRELLNRKLAAAIRYWKDEQARNTQKVMNMLHGSTSARWLGVQARLLQAFHKANTHLRNSEVKRDDVQSSMQVLNQLMIYLSDLVFFAIAALQIAKGDVAVSGILAIYAVRHTFSTPFEFILPLRTCMKQVHVFGERLDDGLSTPTLSEEIHARGAIDAKPDLAIERISYRYHTGNDVLKDVCQAFSYGSHIHIRGASGSGKTTLLKLLARLYEPTDGKICISGIDYAHLTHEQIRDQITYVPQDSMIFADTVKNNIRIGKPGASDDEVANAARKAQIHTYIVGLPEKYDTMLLDFGRNLSVGQRQRIALARAILRNTPVLLLDEISAKVDPQIREDILGTIFTEYADRTVLFISHQYEKMPHCDIEVDL